LIVELQGEKAMTAYCFFDVREVIDPAKLEDYTKQVLATVRQYQGRYRVLGGTCESIEGNWQPVFPVLIEFPDLDLARSWYDSDEYRDVKILRLEGARCDAVMMQSEPGEFIDADSQ
jgi:uncharacterized protein (DUF1330 family)